MLYELSAVVFSEILPRFPSRIYMDYMDRLTRSSYSKMRNIAPSDKYNNFEWKKCSELIIFINTGHGLTDLTLKNKKMVRTNRNTQHFRNFHFVMLKSLFTFYISGNSTALTSHNMLLSAVFFLVLENFCWLVVKDHVTVFGKKKLKSYDMVWVKYINRFR